MITSDLGRDIGFGQPGAFRSLPPAFMASAMVKSSRVFIKPNAVARNRYGYSASTASSDQRAGRGNHGF
jgi:hypothetical protein